MFGGSISLISEAGKQVLVLLSENIGHNGSLSDIDEHGVMRTPLTEVLKGQNDGRQVGECFVG